MGRKPERNEKLPRMKSYEQAECRVPASPCLLLVLAARLAWPAGLSRHVIRSSIRVIKIDAFKFKFIMKRDAPL